MTDDPCHIAAMRAAVNAVLDVCKRMETAPKAKDWLDAHREGDALLSFEAAYVAGRSVETVRRWCSEAEDVGAPIRPQSGGRERVARLPASFAGPDRVVQGITAFRSRVRVDLFKC